MKWVPNRIFVLAGSRKIHTRPQCEWPNCLLQDMFEAASGTVLNYVLRHWKFRAGEMIIVYCSYEYGWAFRCS